MASWLPALNMCSLSYVEIQSYRLTLNTFIYFSSQNVPSGIVVSSYIQHPLSVYLQNESYFENMFSPLILKKQYSVILNDFCMGIGWNFSPAVF